MESPITTQQREQWQLRPDETPVMHQSWQRLLFLHWKYDPEVIQKLLPKGLAVDTWQGNAWVGIVPFYMRNIRPRWAPSVPWISNFLELNLRTYVYNEQGVPGVWFFSLNANRWLAVWLARTLFHLPYHWSRMCATLLENDQVDYTSRRFSDQQKRICEYNYQPQGEIFQAESGTLEFFLAERYILFSPLPNGSLATGQVHHQPYPLQFAQVNKFDEHLLEIDGLPKTTREPDHAVYSPGVDVEVFGLKR